jgi:hypothetical protein
MPGQVLVFPDDPVLFGDGGDEDELRHEGVGVERRGECGRGERRKGRKAEGAKGGRVLP